MRARAYPSSVAASAAPAAPADRAFLGLGRRMAFVMCALVSLNVFGLWMFASAWPRDGNSSVFLRHALTACEERLAHANQRYADLQRDMLKLQKLDPSANARRTRSLRPSSLSHIYSISCPALLHPLLAIAKQPPPFSVRRLPFSQLLSPTRRPPLPRSRARHPSPTRPKHPSLEAYMLLPDVRACSLQFRPLRDRTAKTILGPPSTCWSAKWRKTVGIQSGARCARSPLVFDFLADNCLIKDFHSFVFILNTVGCSNLPEIHRADGAGHCQDGPIRIPCW